jgi:AhpD family alkylhydroperoxidase
MASTYYRFFTPVPARNATGLTAAVYEHLSAEFLGPLPTFMALSAAPDLLAATWALMRESLLAASPPAGGVPRTDREVVASAVSRANRCRFCIDAHVLLLHALGEHDLAEVLARGETPADPRLARLVAWAEASRSPRATGWSAQDHTPEHLGTLLAFHFINRIVSSLLHENLLPGNLQRSSLVRNVGGRMYAKVARPLREPGRSLALLDGIDAGPAPQWAAGSPIGAAYAALRAVATEGGQLLSAEARALVRDTVDAADGVHPPKPTEWATRLVADLHGAERVGARLALLAAVAPSAVGIGAVGLWRMSRPADADLVRLIAFGALAATDHVEAALSAVHH